MSLKLNYLTLAFIFLCYYTDYAQFSPIVHYTLPNTIGPGVPDQQITDIQITEDNTLLVSSYMGGLGIYQDGIWTSITTEEGLKIDYVYSALKDQEGSIWIITEFNLFLYDGSDVILIDEIPYPNCMVMSHAGDLWVGSGTNGLYNYNFTTQDWTHFTTQDGLIEEGIICIFEDRNNNLWIGTDNGVSFFDGNQFTNYSTENGLSYNRIYHIAQDERGYIWCASFNLGADVWNGVEWNFMPVYYVRDMFLDTSDTLWITGSRTLYAFKDNQLIEYLNRGDFAQDGISFSSFKKDIHGNKYMGTYHFGLLKQQPHQEWELLEPDLGLLSNDVEFIQEDSEGKFWFGGNRGLSIFDNGQWNSFNFQRPFIGENLQDIIRTEDGHMWVSDGNHIYEYSNKEFTARTDIQDHINSWIHTIFEDTKGNLWYGTMDGVFSFNGVTYTQYMTADGLHVDDILDIDEDSSGNLWFSGRYGITRFDGVAFTQFLPGENGFSPGQISACFTQKTGDVWVGTREGLSHFDGQNWRTYTAGNSSLKSFRIDGLAEDANGTLWLVGFKGLERYDGNSTFTTFDAANGILYPSNLKSLYFDSDGLLWIGTFDHGVYQIDLSTIVENQTIEAEINIRPNPAFDFLTLSIPEGISGLYQLQLISPNGHRVKYNNGYHMAGEEFRFDVNGVNSGIYFIRLDISGKIFVQRLVVVN